MVCRPPRRRAWPLHSASRRNEVWNLRNLSNNTRSRLPSVWMLPAFSESISGNGAGRTEETEKGSSIVPKVQKTCVVCGKSFQVYPCASITAKTCSYACRAELSRTRMDRQCLNCGSSFKINPSQFRYYKGAGKYCSRSCKHLGIAKEAARNPIKNKYGMSRRRVDRDWQKAVRERDAYTCQRCGVVQRYIHAHHVAPRSRRPDLRHDVSNGKCLCVSCHGWVHTHPREAYALGLLSDASYELAKKAIPWQRSDNVMVTHNGETRCVSEWAKLIGMTAGTLRNRIYAGWSPETALTKPLRK